MSNAMTWALVVVSVLAHELAHGLTAEYLGCRVKRVVVCWRGLGVVRARGLPMQNLLIAAAGPAMSFLLAFLLWVDAPMVAWGNLAFGLLCMLQPNPASDGSKIVTALKQLRWI
jgi:hypothetical protein